MFFCLGFGLLLGNILSIGIPGLIFGAFWLYFSGFVKSEPSRIRLLNRLLDSYYETRYRRHVEKILNGMDRIFSKLEAERGIKPNHLKHSFSFQLLNITLILALAYPILALLANWGISGKGSIGGLNIFPQDVPWHQRVGTICGIALPAGLYFYAERRLSGPRQRVIQLVAWGLFITVALALAAAGTVTVAGTVAFALAFAGTFAFAGAGTFAFAGAVTVAFAVAAAVAGTFAGTFASSGAVVIAGTVAFAITALGEKLRLEMPFLLVLCFAGIFSVFFLIWQAPEFRTLSEGNTGAGAILFVSLLPLMNALADFASLGLTRHFLRKGISSNILINSVFDALSALGVFFILGMAIIATVHHVRPQNNVALFDLQALFAELRSGEGQHLWLLCMVFSTLIPTVVHLLIGLFSAFMLVPKSLKNWIAKKIIEGAKGDVLAERDARIVLCLILTASFIAPIYTIYKFPVYFPILITWVIAIFEAFARSIGAIG